ncbi:MAG: response regulator transcription factor [Mesorhizobium sp.]|nr:response regulator transcription factor [Mesorhizobium sp.]
MSARAVIAVVSASKEAGVQLGEYLRRRGHDVTLAHEMWSARPLFAGKPDLAVVDLQLPGGSGLDLLRDYGGEEGPAFVLVSSGPVLIEKVLALELGAADVIEAPFNLREAATRIGGILTRRGFAAPDLLPLENSTVDLRAALVMHHSGEEEQLSAGQVAMLKLFAAHPHTVINRDDIIAAAPAESYEAFDRSIDSRIVRLRRKLDSESIVTVRGAGYRFDPPKGA